MSRPDRTGRVLRGIGWLGVSSLSQSALRIVLMIVLARLLTPRDYGLIALATAAVALVEIIARLGIEQALIQRRAVSEPMLATASTLTLASALFGTALLMLLAPSIAGWLGDSDRLKDIIRVMALTLPVNALGTTSRAMLSRQGQFRYLGMSELSGFALASFAVALPMAVAGWGVWALVAAFLTQSITTTMLACYRESPRHGWRIETLPIRELLSFGASITGAKLANFVALQADNVVIGKFLGAAPLGAYTRAYALNTLPAALFAQSMERALFPIMSEAQADLPALRRAMTRGLYALLAIFPPLTAYCFVFAEPLIGLFLGSQWGQAIIPFQMLSLAMYFRVAYKLPDVALRAVGRADLNLRLHIGYALMVILAALVGVQHGIVGVALGVGIAIALQYAQALWLAARMLGLGGARIALAHLAGGVVGALTYICMRWLVEFFTVEDFGAPWTRLMMGALLLTAIYGLIGLAASALPGELGILRRKATAGRHTTLNEARHTHSRP